MIARTVKPFLLALAALSFAATAHAQKLTPDEVVLRNYTLTMSKVNAWADASIDYANTLKASASARKTAEDASDKSQEDESIAGMAASLEKVPEIRRAYRKAGFTTREAVTLSLVLMQAMMYEQVASMNPDAKVPYNMNPANVAFIRKNKAAVEARMKEVEAAGKALSDEKKSSDEPSPDDPR